MACEVSWLGVRNVKSKYRSTSWNACKDAVCGGL